MTREQRQRTAARGTVVQVVKAASMSPMSGVAERVNMARVGGLWIVRQCEAPMRALHQQSYRTLPTTTAEARAARTEMIGRPISNRHRFSKSANPGNGVFLRERAH